METGFVNGKGQCSTPYRIDTPQPITKKICHRWLRRRQLQLCQIRCTYMYVHGWLLGTWVKYNQNCFYLCPFLGTHLRVRTVDRFSRMMAQMTRTRARMCFFGISSHGSPFRGSTPKNNFGAWIGVLWAKLAKSKNVHIIKTTASIPTKFCTVIKITKCPSWVVPTNAPRIQDGDGLHLGKSKDHHILAAVRAISTKFGMIMQLDFPNVKNLKFLKSKMAAADILKY